MQFRGRAHFINNHMINFESLVEDVILNENPDMANYKGVALWSTSADAYSFMGGDIHVKGENTIRHTMIIGLTPYDGHSELEERFSHHTPKKGLYRMFPKSVEDAVEDSKSPIIQSQFYNEPDSVTGRFWADREDFLIALWEGTPEMVKKWLLPYIKTWVKPGKKIFIQPRGFEEDQWLPLHEFLGEYKESPEVSSLRREISDLNRKIHTSKASRTEGENRRDKIRVEELRRKLADLTGTKYEPSDNSSLKGSIRDVNRAGDISVAKMKSLERTSESLK